jgi:hypothetical protein
MSYRLYKTYGEYHHNLNSTNITRLENGEDSEIPILFETLTPHEIDHHVADWAPPTGLNSRPLLRTMLVFYSCGLHFKLEIASKKFVDHKTF